MDEKRKVLIIADAMSGDKMLIITDAPKEEIVNWCRVYAKGLEDGTNLLFKPLQIAGYYVRILHDSVLETNSDDIDVIGYDEVYELSDYYEWGRRQDYAAGKSNLRR